MNSYITLTSLGNFAMYVGMSLLMLWAFICLYIKTTPYNEVDQMLNRKMAPTYALMGAMVGFLLPLLSLSFNSVNIIDFAVWAALAGIVQLALFKVLYCVIPMFTYDESDNIAVGVFYACSAICVGLTVAVALIPH
jgi:putative membrane protein